MNVFLCLFYDLTTCASALHEELVSSKVCEKRSHCGQPAADFFCAEKGYGPAYEFSRRTVYDSEEGVTTLHLYEHSTCNPEHQ